MAFHSSRPKSRRPLHAACATLLLVLAACGGDGGTGSGTPNPVPAISAVDPEVVTPGSPAFTLTVDGTNFVRGSVVRWQDADRPTTFVSSTRVTARISAADVAEYGERLVTVANPAPGGGTTAARLVVVGVFGPALTALTPDSVRVDEGGTVTVTGSGIVPGSHVEVGAARYRPPSTVLSPTELRFTLAPEAVPAAGEAWVSVVRPDDVPSSPLTLRVVNPPLVVSALSPEEAAVEQDSLVVHVAGSGFVRSTQARFDGHPRVARRISPTQLDVVLTAQDLTATGTHVLDLMNLGLSGSMVTRQLTLVNPVPTLSAVLPSAALAGQDSLVVQLTGSGFVEASQLRVGGGARPTRRLSRTQLQAVLAAGDLDGAGPLSLSVFNPQPAGGSSGAATLTLTVPVPELERLPAYGASAGGAGFPLVVHGSGFVRSSVGRWNGSDRPTRWISSTRLEMTVSAADVASPRTAGVSVSTPGGGTTGTEQVTVRAPGSAALTSTRVVPLPAVGVAWAPQHGRLYAALDSTAGARANTVVAIDPNTGDVTGSVAAGGAPTALELSDDGSTLWVALGDRVQRFALPGLTPGTSFTTVREVGRMQVMPGHAGTLAISPVSCCGGPVGENVLIYDDGVLRPRGAQGFFEHSLAFGESAGVLYALDVETSARAFRTIEIGGDGATTTRVTEGGLFNSGYDAIQFASGRAYGLGGDVVDAARHARVGLIPNVWGQSSMAVDPALGRVYYFDNSPGQLRVFDLNSFALLGSVSVSGVESQHPARSTERLLRWGTDGLVLSDGKSIHILRSALAGP
jgi:hypothetical protein